MTPGMWWLGGHLGAAVSALVDGQLDEESSERAWAHVADCASCRRLVQREGWVKRQLAEMACGAPDAPGPPSDLLGSLYGLEPLAGGPVERHAAAPAGVHPSARASWAAVEQLERRDRPRRRAGLALVGVGSVSAAVLGLSTLGAAPLGIGGAPGQPPPSALTRATPTGTPAPLRLAPGPGPARAVPASATASPRPGASGVPTAGPFSGWQLRARTDGANLGVPAGSSR